MSNATLRFLNLAQLYLSHISKQHSASIYGFVHFVCMFCFECFVCPKKSVVVKILYIKPNIEPNFEFNIKPNIEHNIEPNIKPNIETNI